MSHSLSFIDSHCHFDFSAFDADRSRVWSAAQTAGVSRLIIPGVSPTQWEKAFAIAQSFSGMFCSLGLHPWFISEWFNDEGFNDDRCIDEHMSETDHQEKAKVVNFEKRFTELFTAASSHHFVAVGECGLDGAIATPLEKQLEVFNWHLRLAESLKKPLIIHSHKANNELIQSLKKYSLPAGGVIHGFSGSYELAMTYCDMGFHLGIGGTITYERAKKTREAVKRIPLSNIVLETDAPDMPLQGKQGERNSPEYILLVAECLARLREEDVALIAQKTTENTDHLFKLR